MIRSYLQKLRRNVEDYGIRTAMGKTLAYLVRPVYESRTYRIYRIYVDVPRPPPGLAPREFSFRWVGSQDRRAIEQIEGRAEWLRGELGEMLARGDLCLTAWHGEVLAAFNLVAFGEASIPLLGRTRRFRSSEAWSGHIAVHKDYRRNHLATELRHRVLDELGKRGVRKLYGGTLTSNLAALRLTRRVGFKEFADVDYLRVLHIKTWRYTKVGLPPRTPP